MALDPIPYVVDASAPEGGAPEGAIPIALFGGPEFSSLIGTVPGVTGSSLQAILDDLASRLADVETP